MIIYLIVNDINDINKINNSNNKTKAKLIHITYAN
jgi:hypothetical protein